MSKHGGRNAQSTQSTQAGDALVDVKDLSVSFMTDAGPIKAIDGVDFVIPRKTVVGVVGESGSGKSVTARSIIRLLPETATTGGAIYLRADDDGDGVDVLTMSGRDLQRMRGDAVRQDQLRDFLRKAVVVMIMRNPNFLNGFRSNSKPSEAAEAGAPRVNEHRPVDQGLRAAVDALLAVPRPVHVARLST